MTKAKRWRRSLNFELFIDVTPREFTNNAPQFGSRKAESQAQQILVTEDRGRETQETRKAAPCSQRSSKAKCRAPDSVDKNRAPERICQESKSLPSLRHWFLVSPRLSLYLPLCFESLMGLWCLPPAWRTCPVFLHWFFLLPFANALFGFLRKCRDHRQNLAISHRFWIFP